MQTATITVTEITLHNKILKVQHDHNIRLRTREFEAGLNRKFVTGLHNQVLSDDATVETPSNWQKRSSHRKSLQLSMKGCQFIDEIETS